MTLHLYANPDTRATVIGRHGQLYEADLFGWNHAVFDRFTMRRQSAEIGDFILTEVFGSVLNDNRGHYVLAEAVSADTEE